MRRLALVGLALLAGAAAACAPLSVGMGPRTGVPALKDDHAVMADGARLPLQVWEVMEPDAVVIAVHGFNDYSNAFAMPGPWLMERGVTTYAYDQRSFGRTTARGYWPGTDTMIDDLASVVALVRARHPETPVHLLGVSMGGAVVMTALGEGRVTGIDGAILVGPAVWGWSSMNVAYRSALWLAAHTVPWKRLSGSGLGILPSDNIEMLRDLSRDPLIIRETRVDAIYGLVGLMERAYEAAPSLEVPVLMLYGDNDEIVPPEPIEEVAHLIPDLRYARYRDGYHMLLRDLQREVVWSDMVAWIDQPRAHLPSHADGLSTTLAALGSNQPRPTQLP